MSLSDSFRRTLVVSPHADDEAMGCAGLMSKLADAGCEVHVIYMAVDGFHHYGLDRTTSYQERLDEIEAVTDHLGCTYEIAYGDMDLIEKLDTLPQRDLVDLFEKKINEFRPDLLLLPYGVDYDQDHRASFQAAFTAARPISEVFGKFIVPHVWTYEMTKINWASEPLPSPVAFTDITDYMDRKQKAIELYATQFRPSPHIRSPESVEALACIRGKEIGVEYAEAFGVFRTII